MRLRRRPNEPVGNYVAHFFKFVATFVLILGISLFIFSITSGAGA